MHAESNPVKKEVRIIHRSGLDLLISLSSLYHISSLPVAVYCNNEKNYISIFIMISSGYVYRNFLVKQHIK